MLDWLDALTALLAGALDSPWLWLVVFLVSGLDALLPFMPSETSVITVAVLLGPDLGGLAALAGVAAAGALAGDVLGHCLARVAGPRALRGLQRNDKGRRHYEWAKERLHRHAGVLVVAGRYVPGGRVAVALATGSLRFPLGRFVVLDAVGVSVWAVYAVAIGRLGAAGFADRPAQGLLAAFGIGLATVGVAELVRRLFAHRARDRARARTDAARRTVAVTSDNGYPCSNASTSSRSDVPTARESSPGSPRSSPRSAGGSSRRPTTPTRTPGGSSPDRS